MLREDLIDRVIFDQRLAKGEGVSNQLSRNREFQMEGKGSAKAQRQVYPWEIGASLASSGDSRGEGQEWGNKGRSKRR